MEIKILQVFYGKDGLPYKDKDRQVHFPIAGTGFLGASNTTKIKFYYDELDNLDETTWVAVSKLPNGKIGSRVLESYLDDELNEHYALLELGDYYTQYKGDVFISLQGYQGGVNLDFNEETQQYEIHGTPTIAATGSIKFTINYANQFVGSGETDNINFQRILAALGTKLGMRAYSEHVEELPSEGSPDVFYVVNDDPNNPNLANIYVWNENTRHYIWVGDNYLYLGNYYTKQEGTSLDGRVEELENEITSLASGGPRGVFSTVSALETADPNHSYIYLVSANNHWYYYNNSTNEWTDGGSYLSGPFDNELDDTSENAVQNKVITKCVNRLGENFMPYNYNITPVYDNIALNQENNLFIVDRVVMTGVGRANEGLQINFVPIPGKIVCAKATRSGGNDFTTRLCFYDENNTRVYQAYGDSGELVTGTVLATYKRCEIIFAMCWGTAFATDVATFTDLSVYYKNVDDELSDTSNLPVQNKVVAKEFEKYPYYGLDNYNCNKIEYVGKEVNNVDNILYKNTSIKITSSAQTYQGLEKTFTAPFVNRFVNVSLDRVGGNNWYFRFIFYASNGSEISRIQSEEKSYSVFIPENCASFKITIAACWGTALANNTTVYINDLVISVDDGYSRTIGEGSHRYIGYEKLNLNVNNYQCNMNVKYQLTRQQWLTLTGQNAVNHQSMAIFNDKVFLFNEENDMSVFDINDIEDFENVTVPDTDHSNSAQFTDIFYNENDTYPLVLISGCEANGTQANLYVLRIQESGGQYTVSLVKTISFANQKIKNYGFSACADLNRRKLIVEYNKNGNWQITTNNPIVFEEYDLPNLTDGNDITLDNGNVVAEYPYFTLQGMTWYDNKIFCACGFPNTESYWRNKYGNLGIGIVILVFDSETFAFKNIIPEINSEAEGICVYNKKLYLSVRNNTNTSPTAIAFRLTEFNFD